MSFVLLLVAVFVLVDHVAFCQAQRHARRWWHVIPGAGLYLLWKNGAGDQ